MRTARTLARLTIAALIGTSILAGATNSNSPVAQASGVTHTITISGPCDNSGATSDWQAVTGRDPLDSNAVAEFDVGDVLKIVNNCDANQFTPFENLSLIDTQPSPVLPPLTGNPSFSDGITQWTVDSSTYSGIAAYGQFERGEWVTIDFSTATAATFLLSDMLRGDSPNTSSLFWDCTDPNNCLQLNHGYFKVVALPGIAPRTQTVSGQVGTAITSTTAFTATNFSGNVTYAVTGANQLPAGLQLNTSTGVISGTPTALSTDTVTVTATGATSGTATATVTFAITAAPATTTTTTTTTTVVATTTTVAPTTTTTVAAGTPTLVNTTNQAALTRTPGSATALVNGVAVPVDVVSPADSAAGKTDPEERTPAQVQQLQQAAEQVVNLLDGVAGGDSGLEVVETDTGAELEGVFPDENVPVEDVVVVDIDESATLFAARDSKGEIVKVQPGAVLEVTPEGEVAVLAYGLPAGDSVELVIMSTPTLLGTYTVDASGSIETRANVPDSIGDGNHTLVVASPNVQAALGLKVSDSAAQALPNAGSDPSTTLIVLLLSIGGLMILLGRRPEDLVEV